MNKSILDRKIIEIFPTFTTIREYIEVALDILEYHDEKKNLSLKEKIDLCKKIGLEIPNDDNISENDYEKYLYSILSSRHKNGRNCFEYLAESGKFDSYNKNKKIPEILVFNGMTQPIFDYKECIFEKVYVEVPLDTDLDGKRDLIAVYVRRPKETLIGMKVPAIYVANPYMMGCNEEWYENMHNVDEELEFFDQQNINKENILYTPKKNIIPPERVSNGLAEKNETEELYLECITDWYNYFNSRGYASVYSAGLGTKGSEGLNSCGSEEEKIWVISVIEWLCGRRKAYTNRTDNIEIKATWCNGSVAMSGKSYLGTLAIAAASTGVDGLKTIIPEAAISNWYNYYHGNGLNMSPIGWQGDDADLLTGYCRSRDLEENDNLKELADNIIQNLRKGMDRKNGNYNKFWDERNYLKDIHRMKASAFIVHGINDWNVKTNHCHLLWKELEKYNIPKKMILHQGDHINIYDLKGINFNEIMNKWLSFWLYDIKNNVIKDIPDVYIQDNINLEKWSNKYEGKYVTYFINKQYLLTNSGEKIKGITQLKDDIESTQFTCEDPNSFIKWRKNIILNQDLNREYRRVYLTEKLNSSMRISGAIKIKLSAASRQETGILSAMIVDIGKKKRFNTEQFITQKSAISLGKNAGFVDEKDFKLEKEETPFKIISRGSINIQNYENNYQKKKVEKNKFYNYEWDLIPTDYNIEKGHKLELIIFGSDVEITNRSKKIREYCIDENSIEIFLPIIKEN